MINFALGEWIMFGALLAGAGYHALGLGLAGAVLFAAVGMAMFGIGFNGVVVGRLAGHPVISLIMVTIGLGALMRGTAALVFRGAPGAHRRMPSGAGHDAQILSRRIRSGMMFVPSLNGISHHWSEDTKEEDIVLGAQVFADAAAAILQAGR